MFGTKCGFALTAVSVCVVSLGTSRAQLDEPNGRQAYADKIRATYNFRFGNGDISTPGNAAVEGDDFIPPQLFCPPHIADAVTRKPTASGARRCTPIFPHAVLSHQRQHSAAHQGHRVHAPLR